MKISVNRNRCGVPELVITADNVHIREDIEERKIGLGENGRPDFRKVTSDIKTEAIEMFSSVLEDMLYYRESEFDGRGLIKGLIEKLPKDVRIGFLKDMNEKFQVEEE